MSLKTPRDLFLHELADMVSAENIFLKGLKTMADEAENADLKKAYSDHHTETQGHLDRLDKMHKIISETPEKTTCHAAEGLSEELSSLLEEKPEGLVKDLGLMICGGKVEHYEISSYTMLATFARDLGEAEVADLIREILEEEDAADKKVRALQRSMASNIKAEENAAS